MPKELNDKERIEALRKEEKNRAAFASVKDALQLIDLTKAQNRTYKTYARESLRTYLRNPASDSNQKNLRDLSSYLYTVSHVYRRLINFKAHQIQCKSWTVYPDVTYIEENDTGQVLQNYERVTKYIRNMNMESQILKCMLQAWKSDVFYGFCYGDPEGDGEFFIHQLNPDYCKISSQQYDHGVLGVAFDLSFFSGANSFYLDVYDPIFKKMYTAYQKDSSLRWQELPIENTFCIKINVDNLDYPVPPLSGLLDSIISLTDLQAIQDLKDELEVYKLITLKIDTLSGTKDVDDFEIDLELANAFYDKINGILPDSIGLALSPMKLDSIDFSSNSANDTNMISDAYQNIINANGGIVLNHNKITNSASFKLALQFDCMDAMAPVDNIINPWIKLWIKNHLGKTGMVVEFSNISPYFVNDRIDQLQKIAQYSVPVKLEIASLLNMTPAKERGMVFLEEALGLGKTSWNQPLISSNTLSGNIKDTGDGSGGAPTKDDEPLTDEGENTKDKGSNDNEK